MNEKQAKRIRKMAMSKAHSQNETTMEGVKARKIEGMQPVSDRVINVVKGHFVQRKLHPFSLKKISKTIKKIFKKAPRPYRPSLLAALSQDLSLIGM